MEKSEIQCHSLFSLKLSSVINYLTNRFHVAVHLFSNGSQMTSKCGKNKKVAHEAQHEVLLYNKRAHEVLLYNKKIKI